MFEVLLKASLAIGITFLFYKLVLQQESFFATNRFYLLGCLALAFILPFITLPKWISQQGVLSEVFIQKVAVVDNASENILSRSEPVSFITPTSEKPSEGTQMEKVIFPTETAETSEKLLLATTPFEEGAINKEYSYIFWITALYLFGVGIFSLSLLFQLSYIAYQILTAPDKIRDNGYVIINTAQRRAPCSFFNYIFIYPEDYDFETYEQIIAHEKTHVRLGHSFDLLFAELAVIVLWFNPFIWFLKKEIEKNNEYQTDSILLEKEEVRKDKYQLNLLQIAVPNKPLNITTNYNQSLIKQRIVMMNSKRSTPHAYWKYAFLAPLFLGIILLMNEPATAKEQQEETSIEVGNTAASIEKNRTENKQVRERDTLKGRTNIVERPANTVLEREWPQEQESEVDVRREALQQRVGERTNFVEQKNESLIGRTTREDITKGVWFSSTKNGKYCIEFRGGNQGNRWNMSNCFETAAFEKKTNGTFVMSNEAGVLELTGNLDAEVGQGKYTFTENTSFRNFLTQKNIDVSSNNMFHLFLGEVTTDYVTYLKNKYQEVDGDELTALAIHAIKQNDFRKFVSLFEGHSGKKAGINDVVSLKIHRVSEDFIRELQEIGFTNLSMDKIMSAKIHGVSAEYSRVLKNAGFPNLTIDKIITASIHRVSAESIAELRALGAKDFDEIVSLQIHRVNSAYVKELQAAGLSNLSLSQVLSAKIHGLSAASIKEIQEMGFKNLDFDDLLSAKIHGVDPAYIKDLEKAGFTNLEINKLLSARIHGVDSGFIEKAKKEGYDHDNIDKYISLKIHGSTVDSFKMK